MQRPWLCGPNLFIVGAPKCGTTSMAAYLDQHPDIFFARVKEPFFFCTDVPHERAVKDESAYLDLFAEGAAHRYRAEGSTWYLYSKVAARAIKAASPDGRIIIMLRDPIELIISQFGYNLIKGNENIEDINRALELEADRRAGRKIPASNRIHAVLYYTDMVDFVPQIVRYWETFGRDRVQIILFDDLKADPGRTVGDVLQFLKLDQEISVDTAARNDSAQLPVRRFGALYRTMVSRKGAVGYAKRLLPQPLKAAVWSAIDRINRRPPGSAMRAELSPAMRAMLATRLRPQVDGLGRLLERDLSHWAQAAPGGRQEAVAV